MTAVARHRIIRPIMREDVDQWWPLQDANMHDPFSRNALESEISNPLARAHGLFDGQNLVAAFLAWLVVDELQILQVVVAPNARRRGIGRQLLDHALAMARAAGATTATLEVRSTNVAAQILYARTGFRVDGRRRGYYPDGEDALLMRLDLGPRR